jgi:predicted DsbA family dithiol-disulfide isomerase
VTLELTLFTDPACPFAFSAEPVRWRLRWHYGDQLQWHLRMIVLTLEPGEAEKLAEGGPTLQRLYGMPIHPGPYPRPASCEPACRAVVAVREHAAGREQDLLRRVRMRVMAGGLIDDPDLLEAAALDAGIDPAELAYWSASAETEAALQADIVAARSPNAAARALDHKLGGPRAERRYTAPSYVLRREDGSAAATVAGFNPAEVYETAIANLAPELTRRPQPASVAELLAWAGEPLATAEIVMVTGLSDQQARGELSRVARAIPVGADAYWIPRS